MVVGNAGARRFRFCLYRPGVANLGDSLPSSRMLAVEKRSRWRKCLLRGTIRCTRVLEQKLVEAHCFLLSTEDLSNLPGMQKCVEAARIRLQGDLVLC